MDYKVQITASAECDLDEIIGYIMTKLCNPQAARHVLSEVESIYGILARTPAAYAECTHPLLRGHRKATFMRYLMIFKIVDDTVYVERFFSGLEDYAHKL